MKPMSRLGWFLFFVYLSLGFVPKAHADSWYIRCGEYSSADGHGLNIKSYRAYFDLDGHYNQQDYCAAAARAWPDDSYHGGVLRDGSQALVQCWCEEVK